MKKDYSDLCKSFLIHSSSSHLPLLLCSLHPDFHDSGSLFPICSERFGEHYKHPSMIRGAQCRLAFWEVSIWKDGGTSCVPSLTPHSLWHEICVVPSAQSPAPCPRDYLDPAFFKDSGQESLLWVPVLPVPFSGHGMPHFSCHSQSP